jgi:diacylglycerol diphosphate phosphatase/phosphatidate phosphatase
MLIAISRVQDYRHAAFDVTWGSIIGIVFGTFAYHQYYPALTARKSHVPHPPRDFGYLVHDSQGQIHEAGHLEMVTGIQRNDSFVDESRVEPEQLHDLETQRPKTPQNPEDST